MPAAKDAIALLKADHRKVEDLFEQYKKARGRKEKIAQQICMELIVHTMIEEEIFYPACRGAVDDDILEEAQVEHDSAKMLIAEIEKGSPKDKFYDAKVNVLAEEIRHHVKEEEKRGGVMAQLKDSDVDLKALGEELKARKDELMEQFESEGLPTPVTRTLKGVALEHGQPVG